MPNQIYLTKTRYTAGLQCLRRLWLNVHEPASWDEPELGSVEDVGLEIGRMAHGLFPGGVLVEEPPWEHAKAVTRTAALMADRSVPAIFEAAFEHSGVRIRVDILERLPRGWWGFREVKSAGEVKDHHYDDVAVQLHVLRKAGVRVGSAQILHVNKKYVRGQNGIAWRKFFSRADVKRVSKKRHSGIEARIKKQLRCLSGTHEPKTEPDAHCHSPYSCEHWEHCTASKPADWVFYMPHLSASRCAELRTSGSTRYQQSLTSLAFPLARRSSVMSREVENRTWAPIWQSVSVASGRLLFISISRQFCRRSLYMPERDPTKLSRSNGRSIMSIRTE